MSKIDILLVNPPPQVTTSFLPIPPLGLLSLASVVENNGFETRILDMGGEMLRERDLLKKIERWQPKLIGFTSTSPTIPIVIKMASRIKKEFDIPICIGGPHATFDLTFLQHFGKIFDYQVIGEGEYAFLWLSKKVIREKKKIKRIIYGKPVKNLDNLPFPSYHLLPMEKYPKIGVIKGSRGCPYRCIFCSVNYPLLRFKSPENVIEEIKFLHEKYNIKVFEFDDENFTLNKKFANEICDKIKKERLDISWGCQSRCDLVNLEILKKMVSCGARNIDFGVETFSERLQRKLKKTYHSGQS